VVRVPDDGLMFTGDLAETGQFAIFPWFPPVDVDVSGLGWLAVMERLAAERPDVVVPGHGAIGGSERLEVVRDYLTELRDETWPRLGDGRRDHQGGGTGRAGRPPSRLVG